MNELLAARIALAAAERQWLATSWTDLSRTSLLLGLARRRYYAAFDALIERYGLMRERARG